MSKSPGPLAPTLEETPPGEGESTPLFACSRLPCNSLQTFVPPSLRGAHPVPCKLHV